MADTHAWQSKTCHLDDMHVHYLRSGRGRRSLIALHGLMGSGACLLPFARTLYDEFDLILPDARGHGGSSACAQNCRYEDLAADVMKLIDALGLDAPVLMGHSMGGMTAAVVARQLGSQVAALVLVDPTFISVEWQQSVYDSDIAAEHQRMLASTRHDLLAQARGRSPARSAEVIEHLVDARLNTSADALEILKPPNPDYVELMTHIRIPALLLLGSRGIVSVEAARDLQNSNPDLVYQLIDDVGHGMPYDAPERLGLAVSTFLRGH